MSYFIANLLQYNKQEDKIYVRGGSNNVVPRSNSFSSYDDKKYLLKDLISGGLDLRCSNSLSVKCKDYIGVIKAKHKARFGERQANFQGGKNSSINPYSLYMISRYPVWNKEETLKNSYDVSCVSEKFKESKLEEARAIEEVFDEAVDFYKRIEREFFDYIGINIE